MQRSLPSYVDTRLYECNWVPTRLWLWMLVHPLSRATFGNSSRRQPPAASRTFAPAWKLHSSKSVRNHQDLLGHPTGFWQFALLTTVLQPLLMVALASGIALSIPIMQVGQGIAIALERE